VDDCWRWFAERLDYSGGRLEDEGRCHHPPPCERPDPCPEVDITDVLSEIAKQLE
jgi:hypothetical protein